MIKHKTVGFLQEFKAFAMRGNVIDLAVAVVIGASFNKIISALVDGVIMPLLGLLLGGINIAGRSSLIGATVVKWGALLQSVIDFTLIAFSIFLAIKLISYMRIEEKQPDKVTQESLLIEIRDLLKKSIK